MIYTLRILLTLGAFFFSGFNVPQMEYRLPARALAERSLKPPIKTEKERGPLIILDAGHGGTDDGAKVLRLVEKRITLTTTLKVKRDLEKLGYRVLLTRSRDVFIPLQRRVYLANKYKGAIFVSIHYNTARNKEAHGIEVFYCDGADTSRMKHSKKLAHYVLSHLVKETSARSRGIKGGNLLVIRETQMPAILVEGGFMSNPEEGDLLLESAYLEKVAKGIADGVHLYFKKEGRNVLGAS